MSTFAAASESSSTSMQAPSTPSVIIAVTGLGSVGQSAGPVVQDPSVPMIYADDLAAMRGDGIFETLILRDDKVHNVRRHEERFLRSATMLGLPEPDLSQWREGTELAIQQWQQRYPDVSEASVRWIFSRGRESTGQPTGWITVSGLGKGQLIGRENGVRVMTAERGYSLNLSERSPWALVGAKTLSYAANMAALRYAHEHDYDDVIFLADDGIVLEGPTSTVIAVKGDRMFTPTTTAGILAGTTQAAMFRLARERGWTCEETTLRVPDLLEADGVWLVSSVRIAARVTAIDGTPLSKPECANEIAELARDAVAQD